MFSGVIFSENGITAMEILLKTKNKFLVMKNVKIKKPFSVFSQKIVFFFQI